MQLKKVNKQELPNSEVLAYNRNGEILIGRLSLGDNQIVLCDSNAEGMVHVTHYIELDEIKPSEPKERTYLLHVSFIANHFGKTAYFDRTASFTRVDDDSIHNEIEDFILQAKNDSASKNNIPVAAVVQLSFTLNETT